MPPAEQRAVLLLLALAVAGQGVRHLLTQPGEPPGQVQLLATLSPGSPGAQRDSAMRQGRPLASGELIDADKAPVSELARLPRVGPRLAKVIQADREANGPFGRLDGLDRVPGIGPGLLKVIGPHLVFSGAPGAEPSPTACAGGVGSTGGCSTSLLNLNTASLAELDALPGVGPAKAAAILQYRQEHGRFTSVDELTQVPGFGPAAVARLGSKLAAQ
jgi:competence protein ComEA